MENRMNFQTSVELPAGMPPVSHADRILLMGVMKTGIYGMQRFFGRKS